MSPGLGRRRECPWISLHLLGVAQSALKEARARQSGSNNVPTLGLWQSQRGNIAVPTWDCIVPLNGNNLRQWAKHILHQIQASY